MLCMFVCMCVLQFLQSLTAGVCQLIAAKLHTDQWTLKCEGVVSFVEDYNKRQYYLRVFNLQTRSVVWEQVL
jgi:hypothetical protein